MSSNLILLHLKGVSLLFPVPNNDWIQREVYIVWIVPCLSVCPTELHWYVWQSLVQGHLLCTLAGTLLIWLSRKRRVLPFLTGLGTWILSCILCKLLDDLFLCGWILNPLGMYRKQKKINNNASTFMLCGHWFNLSYPCAWN